MPSSSKILMEMVRMRLRTFAMVAVNRAGFAVGSNSWVDGADIIKTRNKFAPEVHDRAIRMVLDYEPRGAGPSSFRPTATP